jgi:hypothetical protein
MLCYDWRTVGQSFLVSGTHLGHMARFLILSDISGIRLCGALPFTITGGSCQRSHSRIRVQRHSRSYYILIFETPNLEVPIFISPKTRWPSYTPRNYVPFSPPHVTCRATMENLSQTTYYPYITCAPIQQWTSISFEVMLPSACSFIVDGSLSYA